MIRQSLNGLPQHGLAEGYSIRLFRRGDAETWVRVEQESEPWGKIDRKTFDQNFGDDCDALARRQLFLVSPQGRDCGTVTSWYTRRYHGRAWGRIHWLAVAPQHRGKGLSKALMTAAMNRMRSLGHRRAMLVTDTRRLIAIKTYLDFGFAPDMRTPNADRAWRLIRKALDHPALR